MVFASELGWMCLRMRGEAVRQLSFGHRSAAAARQAIAPGHPLRQKPSNWQREVVQRLLRYAEGLPVDFCDLPVDSGAATGIPSSRSKGLQGNTLWTNHDLRRVGRDRRSARGSRAVGNCMAGNHVPLIVPCHRVVRAGGQIGPYSAAGGTATKRRLLIWKALSRFPARSCAVLIVGWDQRACDAGPPRPFFASRARQVRVNWARLLKGDKYTSLEFQDPRPWRRRTECRATSGPRWIGFASYRFDRYGT